MLTDAQYILITIGFWTLLWKAEDLIKPLFKKDPPGRMSVQVALSLVQCALWLGAIFWFNTRVLGEQVSLGQWTRDLGKALLTLFVLCALFVPVVQVIDKRGSKDTKNISGLVFLIPLALWLFLAGQGWFSRFTV